MAESTGCPVAPNLPAYCRWGPTKSTGNLPERLARYQNILRPNSVYGLELTGCARGGPARERIAPGPEASRLEVSGRATPSASARSKIPSVCGFNFPKGQSSMAI